jgi:selenocysteine-specific elongation factor
LHVVGTAGHVDHGKSSLVQRLTGIDPDRFVEEKERGLTIDLGFAWLQLPSGNEIGIVDVPGHERFIKNMLAGAGGISVCLFVVAANEGWMPQSTEHVAILDLLGLSHGVVAITKSDLVDGEALEDVVKVVSEKLDGTTLAAAPIVPCSVVSGQGLEDLVTELDRAVSAAPASPDKGRPRLWIDRVFTIAGAGTVVTGTLGGGKLSVGDSIEIAPEGRRARIRRIQSHKKDVDVIAPGHRTALNLVGLEREGAARGDAVVSSGQTMSTRRFDVQLRAVDGSEITEKGAHLLYVGSAEVSVRVKLIGTERIRSGTAGYAQLTIQDPLPLRIDDRFVLRDAGRVRTIGGGRVLDPLPSPARRTDIDRASTLEALANVEPAARLSILIRASGRLERGEALWRAGVDAPSGDISELGDWFVSAEEMKRLTERAKEALTGWHHDHPLERVMPKERLREALGVPPDAFDALVDSLDDVIPEGAGVRSSGHAVKLAPEQERARREVIDKILDGGFAPPVTEQLGVDPDLVRSLTDAGELIRIGDFHLTAAQAADARRIVRSHIAANGPTTVAQIRDLLGTTRKYAVPLCEWLDSTGATRRSGDLRALGPRD